MFKRLSALMILLLVTFLQMPEAGAVVPRIFSVEPAQAGLGGKFLVKGVGFGNRGGLVNVGGAHCRVLRWSSRGIYCVMDKALSPGPHDIVVRPFSRRSFPPCTLPDGMNVMPPEIHTLMGPANVVPYEEVTIHGAFFGTLTGSVQMVSGETRIPCEIVEWRMDRVTVTVPDAPGGVYGMEVSNLIGIAWDDDFLNLVPDSPMPGDYVGGDCSMSALKNAQAVYYLGKLWLFFPVDYSHNIEAIAFVRYDLTTGIWESECHYLKLSDGTMPVTGKGVVPLLVRDGLLVFWMEENSSYRCAFHREETLYDQGKGEFFVEDVWDIGDLPYIEDATDEPAPVYNPTTNRLELYYKLANKHVYWISAPVPPSDQPLLLNWDRTQREVVFQGGGVVYTDSAPTATFVRTGTDPGTQDPVYQTMLAYRDTDSHINIAYLNQNGTGVKHSALNEKTDTNPFVTNTGVGQVALVWRGTSGYVNILYYDEANPDQGDHGWVDKHKWGTMTMRHPTATVAYAPSTSKAGADLSGGTTYPDLIGGLYVFYDPLLGLCHWRKEKDLGSWRYQGTTTVDFDKELSSTFDQCPILGVVDAPPFVYNGGTIEENLTCLTLYRDDQETTSFELDLKAGAFFEEGGKKSPIEMQVSVGAHYAYGTEFSRSLAVSNANCATDGADIMLVMLVPVFDFVEYEWFDYDEHPSGNTVISVSLNQTLFIRPQQFAADSSYVTDYLPDLPTHVAGCVNTYKDEDVPDGEIYAQASAHWYYVQDETAISAQLVLEDSVMDTVGGYAKFKMDAKLGQLFKVGFEGEFNVNWTNVTKVTRESKLNLWNPKDKQDGDVSDFDVHVYWIEPDADGAWVPSCRKDSGDRPWYITYSVRNIEYMGGMTTPGCESFED